MEKIFVSDDIHAFMQAADKAAAKVVLDISDGADGADGRTILNGTGAPAGGLGEDGDFYIDTAANEIYGPKTSGAWGSATSLVGPQGPAGDDGTDGDPGADGSDGADAPEVQIQYSSDGLGGWSATYTEGDAFIRFSTDDGGTWSAARRFRGEDGADGEDGGGASLTKEVNQTAHGFAVGDIIRVDSGAGYAKAQADAPENADVVGYVIAVADANNFTFAMGGMVEVGVPNEPAETVMFLSPTTAGALTTTEPTAGQVRKTVLIIREAETSAFFTPQSTGFLIPDPQAQFDEDVQALGDIDGATEINLALGTAVTATLTGAVTLTFAEAGRPASGRRWFSLQFTNVEDITWPAGTLFVGDAAPTAFGTVYELPCQINNAGVVTVLGVLDAIGDAT